MRKSMRWQVAPRVSSLVVARFPELHPLIVQVLFNRGISTPEQAAAFLSPESAIGNPFQILGMGHAVDRLRRAIRAHDPIAVYGDFDVDGVTATVLLVQTLEALGAKARPYIPHRIDEGYGLNREALQQLKEQGVRVVVTVDCGVRSLEEVAFGEKIGLDMIVTDHHAPGDRLPASYATVNPKQPGCPYPYKDLSGAGVAFKLAQALLRADERAPIYPRSAAFSEEALVDLVALGTVADLVPLTGENRVLVRRGLVQLRDSERPGVQALIRQAGVRAEAIETGTIGYTLGPRLNAAGRLESALMAYNLLATHYPGEAESLALRLEETNRERQRLTTEMTAKAREAVVSDAERDHLIFVSAPEFPEGIVGLVASRLAEEFYRPAFAVHRGEDESRGSARSIYEFNVVAALDECKDLLVRHGGHAMAAGFTVENDKLEALETRLRSIAERSLSALELAPSLAVDAQAPLSEMDWSFHNAIEELAPFGYGNREPVFLTRNIMVRDARPVGGEHLKLLLSDGQVVWDAIAFRQASWVGHVPDHIDVAYQLQARRWGGESRLQLNVKDIRPVEEA